MTRYGMLIDAGTCAGCNACTMACKYQNATPSGMYWCKVLMGEYGTYPNSGQVVLPSACMHCQDAPCVSCCPTGASHYDENGCVQIDYEKCIGCRYCITACPYEVRQFNWSKPEGIEGVDGEYRWGYPEDYRQDGRLVYTPVRPEGVVEKCTFCVQYTNQGGIPACCTGARQTPAYSATSRIPSPRSRSIFPGASGSSSANRTAPTRRCITCLPSAERGSNHDGANS